MLLELNFQLCLYCSDPHPCVLWESAEKKGMGTFTIKLTITGFQSCLPEFEILACIMDKVTLLHKKFEDKKFKRCFFISSLADALQLNMWGCDI